MTAAPGSPTEALRAAITADPRSLAARVRFADALARAGRPEEAEEAVRAAFAAGLDGPDLRLILARTLQAQDRHEAAEAAYRDLVARAPGWALAQRELAQLVWMRTGNAAEAGAALDAALLARPDAADLRIHKAKLLEYAGDLAGAYETLDAAVGPDNPFVHVAAAQIALRLDPDKAIRHAERACALMVDGLTLTAWCEALLAAGRAEEASRTAARLCERDPLDQHAIALQATAWRLLGDARYRELYDYDRFVRVTRLDTPAGWPTLEAWLADLAPALKSMHGLQAHPVGQSLRGGSQTMRSLEHCDDPAVRAFFAAADGPIRRELEAIGRGDDPLGRRNTGEYAYSGVWSVRLRANGFHVDHVHPAGWLSSACYVELPEAVERDDGAGRLKFGEPGTPTRPSLAAERVVKPEPGMLVLFPSYMWHGTAPFTSDETRLTIAFDLVPA